MLDKASFISQILIRIIIIFKLFIPGAVTKTVLGERSKMNSKQKGARGERELAHKLKDYGYDCRRGQQYNGLEGEDVVGLPGIHIECKRVERLNIYDAIDQARRDSAETMNYPVVFHRKDHCEWLVTMPLEYWINLYREWENGR